MEAQLKAVQYENARLLNLLQVRARKGQEHATPVDAATLDVNDFEGPEQETLGWQGTDSTDDEKEEEQAAVPGAGWDTKRFEDFVRTAESMKSIGNGVFQHACECADELSARATAQAASIYYLDAIDFVENTSPRDMSPEQAATRNALLLVLQLNHCAALNKDKEWRLSLRAANAALDIDSTNIKALYRRGVAFAGLGSYAEAEADFNAVLRLDPSNRDAKLKLAEMFRNGNLREKRKLDKT